MRLTLRTLLAYLDDTLEPSEIKQIGQKVAESDAAQELIARIKQVTRRRRLTAPPTTGQGSKFDANMIAEYLDNTLASEQVAEVEKICLESDVHLAEIAACHQILTLVLGEPALVPPTARRRMYTLVRGRESVRSRRSSVEIPQAPRPEAAYEEPADQEETLLLGLPFFRQSAWVRWLVPLTAVVLLTGLFLAIWSVLPGRNPNLPVAKATRPKEAPAVPASEARKEPETKKEVVPEPKAAPEPKQEPEPAREPTPEPKKEPEPRREPAPRREPEAAAAERREVGRVALVRNLPNILLQKRAASDQWQRLDPGKPVATTDALVALPGCRSSIRLDSGADLTLWGNLPDFLPGPLLESGVTLNTNAEADLDVYLDRGRVVLSNQKASGSVRCLIRFNEEKTLGKPPEVWNLTLESPDTEVMVDMMARYTADVPHGSKLPPLAVIVLVVLKGQTQLKIGFQTLPVNAGSFVSWNNKSPWRFIPQPVDAQMQEYMRTPPITQGSQPLGAALDELIKRPANRPIELTLDDFRQSERVPERTVGIYGLGALDDVSKLLDCLADEDDRHGDVRNNGHQALLHWLGRRYDHEAQLSKVLIDVKKYKESDADTILQLLHDFPQQQLGVPQTWDQLIQLLRHNRPAIRELAFAQLTRYVPQGRDPRFYPGGDSQKRESAFREWKKLIPDGQLPPAAQRNGPAPR